MRVSIVQKKNVFLNKRASLDILQKSLNETFALGAEVVVFPETWLPGYPVWIDAAPRAGMWREKGAMQLYRILCEQALDRQDPIWSTLQKQVNETNCVVFLGIHERSGHSLFNTMVLVAAGLDRPLFHRNDAYLHRTPIVGCR